VYGRVNGEFFSRNDCCCTTMSLHNFIRENDALDEDFERCDRDPDYVPTIPTRYRRHVPQDALDTSTPGASTRNMNRFHDDLAKAIWQSR
jgi:hypothetical protein